MFEKRPILCYEGKYTFVQSPQISSKTGLIGYLRGELDKYGRFFSFWINICKELKTREFKDEFDSVINELREEGNILHNKISLDNWCYETPHAKIDTDRVYYGFRVDSESYIYLFRVTPKKGDYNVYCFCYKKKWLDYHMKEAYHAQEFAEIMGRIGATVRPAKEEK